MTVSLATPEHASHYPNSIGNEIDGILYGKMVDERWRPGVEELVSDPYSSVMSETDLLGRLYKDRTDHVTYPDGRSIDKFATRNSSHTDVDIIFTVATSPDNKKIIRITTDLQGQLDKPCTVYADSDGNFDVLCHVYKRGTYENISVLPAKRDRILRALFYDTLQATDMIDERTPEQAKAADDDAMRLMMLHVERGRNI